MLLFTAGGPDSGRIGDSLAMLPFMLKTVRDRGPMESAQVHGLNPAVADLIAPVAPFFFNQEIPEGAEVEEFVLNVQEAYWNYSPTIHMAQSYFQRYNCPVPELPIAIDFPTRGVQNYRPDIAVIAPYSWTDWNGNKLWPHDRWISVVERLRAQNIIQGAYVVGSSSVDDYQVYANWAITPFFDRSLADVLNLIQSCGLFLSVDNGISHLAHYASVSHHVLLYPGCLKPTWVCNPHGIMVRRDAPAAVTVDDIMAAVQQVLVREHQRAA
jgi:hypothetical protein